jgi:hypothetical protein
MSVRLTPNPLQGWRRPVAGRRPESDDAGGDVAGNDPASARAAWIGRINLGFGFAITLSLVLAIHGFWWGESEPIVQTIVDAGSIQCLHNQGLHILTATCHSIGQPLGFTFLLGMPEVIFGTALSWVPGIDAWTAHQLLNVLLDTAALTGGYLLLRRWNVIRPFALIAAATYLITPSLLGLNGYGYTFTGYTFLPLYYLLFLHSLDAFTANRPVKAAAILTGTIWLMIFTDGYSYATGLMIITLSGLWWAWRSPTATTRAKLLAATTYALANATGYLAYTAYINASAKPAVGLGAFRLLGLDPITLFIPQKGLYWPRLVGYVPPTLHLWGNTSNISYNYLGYTMLGLVIWMFAARALRGEGRENRREIVGLAVGGLACLLLSLGPALKLNSHPIPVTPDYNVPTSATVLGLPTTFLYAHVPPFSSMRATFRWSIGLRFFVVFAAAVALSLLWRRGRRILATALLVLAVLEVAPVPLDLIHAGERTGTALKTIRTTAVAEFTQDVKPGERVVMVPSTNDFLSLVLTPFAHVNSYNAAGDKNLAAIKAHWPASVQALARHFPAVQGVNDQVAAVLAGDADVVVISYVDLMFSGLRHLAMNKSLPALQSAVAQLSVDPRFVVNEGKYFATVRMAR